jgi:hypothetical protein
MDPSKTQNTWVSCLPGDSCTLPEGKAEQANRQRSTVGITVEITVDTTVVSTLLTGICFVTLFISLV